MGGCERFVTFRPLHDWCWRQSGLPKWRRGINSSHEPGTTFTDGMCAEMLGVSARQVQRWLTEDRMTVQQADKLAVRRLGVHPAEVWRGEWVAPGRYADVKVDEGSV